MSTSVDAPQQFKQTSRKGKKAWRKNVDITAVQEGLRELKDAEITGGLISEKPSDELFVLDTVGNEEVRKSIARKQKKPLKSDEILAQRSKIPALDGRKRVNPNVTDGVIEPKTKKPKSDWVSQKEYLRLKQVAKEGNPLGKKTDNEFYDPWAEDAEPTLTYDDPRFDFLQKPKPKVEPVTLKHAPISLAANGKPIPSVKMPHAGTSYNPVFEEWDKLLETHGAKAVEAEKRRLEEEAKEAEKRRLIEEAKNDNGEVKSDDESAWEGFESEYEKSEWLNKKRPERKSKTQRNKVIRRKAAEGKAKWEAARVKRDEQAQHILKITEQIQQRELERQNQSDADDSEDGEGDDTTLRRKTFGGKRAVPEQPLELVLPDELQDSLRLLKPEGNLLDDRFRTLIVQGKLESRTPITQARKARRQITEKWAAKDFKTGYE
ncbi:tumor suppressor protein Gltscr2 [Penicillium expansum]|uniref:Ribosome biogenesis protein NOP53 n=1 Tax=Penicillium expansum TaxID=27334 RepID=A0A0A2JDD3_PENEN|nr:tumor suppressor protein Gltscr2 [Penicillium expansum]KGO52801.1 tumor suppressor protein Gltscr2 [Penicillium expansum]